MKSDEKKPLLEMSDDEKRLVKSQLKTILASTYFNSAKQMTLFLKYVVEKTLAGEGHLLKQYTIGVEALNLPVDFDSDSNPVVRIMGGRVRNRLDEFYENTENNEIFIVINKGTYTPEFSKYSNKKNTGQSKFSNKNRMIETSSGPRVALVSFNDQTQSKISNRLLLQVTDVLAKELSKFILAKLIIFNPFSDKNDSYKIHKETDADYKLALFIQDLSGDKYELLCRLTNFDAEVLWSESYEINNEIQLKEQEEVLTKIITMVVDLHQGKLHLDWARKLLLNKDNIPEKFQVVAYFRQFYDNLNRETCAKAIDACESALQRNADDIIANILMADLCRRDYVYDYNLIDSPVMKGLEYARRAVHLRQDSHEAHFALGQMLFYQGERERSLEELELARSINYKNATVEYACGFYFCCMDNWVEGISIVKRSMAISSNYPSWQHMIISLDYFNKNKYKEALIESEKIVSTGVLHGPLLRCIAHAHIGNIALAILPICPCAYR